MAKILEQAVTRTGLSRRKLAERLGTSPSILHRLSTGDTSKVDLRLGLALLDAAGVTPSDFLGIDSPVPDTAVVERLDTLTEVVQDLSDHVQHLLQVLEDSEHRRYVAQELMSLAARTLDQQAALTTRLPVDELMGSLDTTGPRISQSIGIGANEGDPKPVANPAKRKAG